jgi:hypothetical protein
MAGLSAKKRSTTSTSDFGLPEKARTSTAKKKSGNYPMPDAAHARNAKARAAQQEKAGRLSKADRERVDRKADKVLGTGKGKKNRKKKGKGKGTGR